MTTGRLMDQFLPMRELSIQDNRREWAVKKIGECASRIQRAEFFLVAEELGFEFGIVWNEQEDGQMKLRLSDLQLFAFASALMVHREYVFGTRTKAEEKPKRRRRAKQ